MEKKLKSGCNMEYRKKAGEGVNIAEYIHGLLLHNSIEHSNGNDNSSTTPLKSIITHFPRQQRQHGNNYL